MHAYMHSYAWSNTYAYIYIYIHVYIYTTSNNALLYAIKSTNYIIYIRNTWIISLSLGDMVIISKVKFSNSFFTFYIIVAQPIVGKLVWGEYHINSVMWIQHQIYVDIWHHKATMIYVCSDIIPGFARAAHGSRTFIIAIIFMITMKSWWEW